MKHSLLFGLFAVALVTRLAWGGEPVIAGNDWPTGRGPAGDGKSPLTGIRKDWTGGLKKVWETAELLQGDTANISHSIPVVARGILVAMGRGDDKDLVFAFQADTGKKLWTGECPAKAERAWAPLDVGNGARAAPIIDGDSVYTLGAYGQLACWELKTGRQKWLVNTFDDSQTKLPCWGVCGTPVICGGNIIVKVGGFEQGPAAPLVMAYDKQTGKLAWKSGNAIGSWAPLAVFKLAGKDQLLAWHATGLKGLDPRNGNEFWNIPWRTTFECHATLPVVEGSCLFMTSGYKTGCQAFDVTGDKPAALWPQSKAIASCTSDPIVADGLVYCFSGDGWNANARLKCLDLKTGAEKWAAADFGNGTLVLVDGCLLCLGYRGKLGLVEATPEAYRKLAEMQVFNLKRDPPAFAAPAIANGKLYVRYCGTLACYDLMP